MAFERRMKVLSASQIDTYRDCPRKWAYQYLESLRAPPRESAALGTRVHEILEAYLRDGSLPDLSEEYLGNYPGQIAKSGMHLLPPPGSVDVEQRVNFQTEHSLWQGRIDAVGPDFILDHKTSKDRRYTRDLAIDVQAALYAHAFGNSKELRWIYYHTQRRDAWMVRHRFSTDELAERIADIDSSAHAVQRLYTISPKADEVPYNTAACQKYGGCPHQSYCPKTKAFLIGANDVNIEDFLAMQEAKIPAVPTKKEAWKPGDAMNPAQEYLAGLKKPLSIVAMSADVPPSLADALSYDREPVVDQVVNPPEAPKIPAREPAEMPPVPPIAHTDDRKRIKAKAVELGLIEENSRLATATIERMLAEHDKREELAKSFLYVPDVPALPESKELPTVAVEAIIEACSPKIPALPTAQAPKALEPVEHKFYLYINCAPVGVTYVPFHEIYGDLCESLREAHGVLDYRDIEYGKGAARLVEVAQEYFSKFSGRVTIDSDLPESRVLLTLLQSMASGVVRGR